MKGITMATLRGRLAALIGAMVILSAVLLAGGTALGQTGGYPPPTTTVGCTPGNVNAGTVLVGQTIPFTLCGGFTPGATITITVNGNTVLTKTPVNGAVVVVVTVQSDTELLVGDPVQTPAACGTNTVVATGAGTVGTSTGTFNLVCAAATTTTSTTVKSTTTSTTLKSTTTSNSTTPTTANTTSTTSGGALALTGAHIIELLLAAAALILIGALLVSLQRRRRQGF